MVTDFCLFIFYCSLNTGFLELFPEVFVTYDTLFLYVEYTLRIFPPDDPRVPVVCATEIALLVRKIESL